MIKNNHKRIFSFILCMLLAPQALSAYTQITNDIELTVNDCSAKPEKVLVYTNTPVTAGQFLQKGIHPVRLKITNKSDAPIIVSGKSIFKEQVDAYQAARMFHIDNQFTSSLFLDYYLLTIGINTICLSPLGGIASIVIPIIPPGSIIAAIYYFKTKGKNNQLNQDFNRALTEQNKNGECVIQPGSSLTKIVLLKKEHRIPRFTFRVFDEQNKQAVASFEVALEN